MDQCAWCFNQFNKVTISQIYCSVECRQAATKHKVAQQYRAKRKTNKKKKLCSGGCGTVLSMYNEVGFCTICMNNQQQFRKVLREIKGIANGKIPEC